MHRDEESLPGAGTKLVLRLVFGDTAGGGENEDGLFRTWRDDVCGW
jgi:hypothetical protein